MEHNGPLVFLIFILIEGRADRIIRRIYLTVLFYHTLSVVNKIKL